MKRPVLILVCTASLLLQFYARFAAAPVVDFTLDDWALLQRAAAYPSTQDAAKVMLHEPDRPIGAGFLTLTFRAFGDSPVLYNLYSYAVNSLFLLILVLLAFELTGSPLVSCLAGLFFSIFPNLTESFNWHTMVAYAPGCIGYAASALFWVCYIKSARFTSLLASVVFFAIGLGTYEFGIGIPLAFAILIRPPNQRRNIVALMPFAVIVAFYLLWKFTKGFGMAHGVLFPSRSITWSFTTALWNAKEIVSWWIGGNMISAIREGFDGFADFGKWSQRWLIVGNVVAAALLARYLFRFQDEKKQEADPVGSFSMPRVLVFGIGWAALTHAPSLVSWTGGRLNYLPAAGVALALAALLSKLNRRTWVPLVAALAVMCLTADQGTAHQWHESGRMQRRLYQFLQAHQSEWVHRDVVLIDTATLRQFQERRGLTPPGDDPQTWAYYGNAGLIRGFTPTAMMALIQPAPPRPQCVLDVECEARIEGDQLQWHERWDPSKLHVTPLDRVFIMDCLAVGSGQVQ